MKNRSARFTTLLPTLLFAVQRVVDPFIALGALIYILVYYAIPLEGHYLSMAIIVFLLSLLVFKEADLLESWSMDDIRAQSSNLLISWAFMVFILVFLGYLTSSTELFEKKVLYTWALVTPALIFFVHVIFRIGLLLSLKSDSNRRKVVIVGANKQSRKLADSVTNDLTHGLKLMGYFDDRSKDRVGASMRTPCLGSMDDLPAYVKNNNIDLIYITVPIRHQDRVLDLLDKLNDTTASIYFTPDIFVYDLIQARIDDIDGTPLVALCETPFSGLNGLIKRLSDVVFASIILVLISPILLVLVTAVKLSSPGPALFAQKRYGLDGEEIVVYKLRSMTVCEDGDTIKQATRNDARITRLGAILRKYSLDELPQFINVLQGRMSIVGPRPHAVAHNELYRGMIKGYMIRHKVKPGITGWAQVNGSRGETDTVDKMKQRIEYDLDYLRNWSVGLDLIIILNTISIVFKNTDTY